MTPKEVAIDLIRTEVERGDDMASIKNSWMGRSSQEYVASVGGAIFPEEYLNGKKDLLKCPNKLIKKVNNDRILVEEINGRVINQTFPLAEIYKIIKEKRGLQLSIYEYWNEKHNE